MGSWLLPLWPWREAAVGSDFQIPRQGCSCTNREDVDLGRKRCGYKARVSIGWRFPFPLFRSPRIFIRICQAVSKVVVSKHGGSSESPEALIKSSDHWSSPCRFWFRQPGCKARGSVCLTSIPGDSARVDQQESFGKVQKSSEGAALSDSSRAWLLCPFYRREHWGSKSQSK